MFLKYFVITDNQIISIYFFDDVEGGINGLPHPPLCFILRDLLNLRDLPSVRFLYLLLYAICLIFLPSIYNYKREIIIQYIQYYIQHTISSD